MLFIQIWHYKKQQNSLVVKVQDNELQAQYTETELIVNVPTDIARWLPVIFEVTLAYGNTSEVVQCWTFVPAEIESNRYSVHESDTLDDVEIDSTGDKFAEDYTKLIEAFESCAADLEDNQKTRAMEIAIQQEQEESYDGDSESEVDFIVEDDFVDAPGFEHRRFEVIDRFRRQFLRRFLCGQSSLFFTHHSKHEVLDNDQEDTNEEKTIKPRKATTAEKRFERFVKRRINAILNPTYVSLITVEHYIGIMEVVFEIFRKYNHDDPVEDIFDTYYVIDTRLEFYMNLLTKDLKDTENLNNLEETVISNCLAVIIENREIDDSDETYMANRSFLILLEKRFSLRDDYRFYIQKSIDRDDAAVIRMGYDNSCDYIDMLYGYKSNKQLLDEISKLYKGSQISIIDKKLTIKAQTGDISSHFYPNRKVLAEIAKYSSKCEPIDVVYIELNNSADIRYVKNIATRIRHTIQMNSRQWICEIDYKFGSANKSKPRRIDF